jgi:pyruvate kinase
MHLPNAIIDIPTITAKDQDDIDFGVAQGKLDLIIVSYVRKADEVTQAKNIVEKHKAKTAVYARIENHEGLNNFEDILKEADGIVIARGPLSMDLASEKVYQAQNWMIEKANQVAKPVIISTQILDSMMRMPKPSRAEAADVCQTIISGADAIMLFSETAEGQFPIITVNALAKICVEGERTLDHRRL